MLAINSQGDYVPEVSKELLRNARITSQIEILAGSFFYDDLEYRIRIDSSTRELFYKKCKNKTWVSTGVIITPEGSYYDSIQTNVCIGNIKTKGNCIEFCLADIKQRKIERQQKLGQKHWNKMPSKTRAFFLSLVKYFDFKNIPSIYWIDKI